MTPLYDQIGTTYDVTRKADPEIVRRLRHHLNVADGNRVLDVACGTGNYTVALAGTGLQMTGYDISTVMIENAREKFEQVDWHEGDVHQLPYESGVFQGAVCTLSIHHFEQLAGAFREVYRTLDRGRFVIFTSSPEQMKHYWLNEYFPEALEKSITQMPSIETVNEALKQAGFTLIGAESFLLDPHIQDLFLYSGKFAPELYLDERIRSGMSTFAHLASVEEVRAGCAKLKLDIETNKIKDVLERYHSRFGDYMYVVAEKK